MTRSGWLACASLAVLALVGCNRPSADTTPSTPSSAPAVSDPTRPDATADDNAWGKYLAALGKLHGEDVRMRPYIYVIPGGDSAAATSRRQEEADSISRSIGPILIPGSMLIVGGSEGAQTEAFLTDLSKELKAGALKGIVVLVVSDAARQSTMGNVLKPTGAIVRFVAM